MHKSFDRQIVKRNDGQYYKIFHPSWWEIWRWIFWLFVSKFTIKIKIDNEEGSGELFLRCYKVKDGVVKNRRLLSVR